MSDADMRAYLRGIRRDLEPRGESIIWTAWATTAAHLGFSDLRLDAILLNKEGFIDERDFDADDFDRKIALARSDPAGLAGFERDLVRPFDDAIGTLESWVGDDGDLDSGEGFEPEELATGQAPYFNPYRGVRAQRPVPVRQRQEIQEVLPFGVMIAIIRLRQS